MVPFSSLTVQSTAYESVLVAGDSLKCQPPFGNSLSLKVFLCIIHFACYCSQSRNPNITSLQEDTGRHSLGRLYIGMESCRAHLE